MKKLSHGEVQRLIQDETDLDETVSEQIQAHLSSCQDCRTYAVILADLKLGSWSPYDKPRFSSVDKTRIQDEVKSQVRRSKMFNGIFKPTQAFVGAVIVVVFLMAIYWLLPGSFPQSDTAMPAIRSTQPDETRLAHESQILVQTQTPAVASRPTKIYPSATVAGDRVNAYSSEPGYKIATESISIDFDCDGVDEELLTWYWVSANPAESGNGLRDYTAVEVKISDGRGSFQTAWRSDFNHSPREERYGLALFSISGCEQLIALSSWDWSHGAVGQYTTKIYQYDGSKMQTVLDVPESLMDLTGKMMIAQPADSVGLPFILSTFYTGYPDPNKGTCDRIVKDYAWDGNQFIFVENRTEHNQSCDGSGG